MNILYTIGSNGICANKRGCPFQRGNNTLTDVHKDTLYIQDTSILGECPQFSFSDIFILCRPSTPIFDLLENRYQEKWLAERREIERKQREKLIKKVHLKNRLAQDLWLSPLQKLQGKVYETRASLLRRYSEPVDPPPLWKIKRFNTVSNLSVSISYQNSEASLQRFHLY